MGVSDSDIVLEPDSKDTKDEAVLIQKIVGNEKLILVTSASHMPRSMALFKKRGMQPIPAPTDHTIKRRQRISPGVFFPAPIQTEPLSAVLGLFDGFHAVV